jgi:hypothetical protein
MPKPNKFTYEKKEPFRDAFYFIIVCEGQNREPDYFSFFDGISSRVKIVSVKSESGASAPGKLIERAMVKEVELDARAERDRLWFVIDTDRWRDQLREIRQECAARGHWNVAQSNPCFEVWLYFHVKDGVPALDDIAQCKNWKPYLPTIIQGGFNSDTHPVAIEAAIINAKASYKATGYEPHPGSTELWRLGEELLPLIRKELDDLKNRFNMPKAI